MRFEHNNRYDERRKTKKNKANRQRKRYYNRLLPSVIKRTKPTDLQLERVFLGSCTVTEYKSAGKLTILLEQCLSKSSTHQTNTSFENYNYKMCCLSYDRPSSPRLSPSYLYPKCHEVQRPPRARTHQMEYAPHGKKPERKYTHREAQRRPNGRRHNEKYVPRGRKPKANHSSNRDVSPLPIDYRRHNSHPISPISTIHPLHPNALIPNRFDTISAVSSLQLDDIQDTSTVRPTPKMRAPRARVAQAIDRPAKNTPGCKPVISRPPPAVVYESKPETPPYDKPRDRSAQAETKHRPSRPCDDKTEWPLAHPNRLSRPFGDMPAFYRENTPPPPPTIAQRRRQKKKAQAEKQEHMLWHGVKPPRKDSPFVGDQFGAVKGNGREDVWYYHSSWILVGVGKELGLIAYQI